MDKKRAQEIYRQSASVLTALERNAPASNEASLEYFNKKAFEFAQANAQMFASEQIYTGISYKKTKLEIEKTISGFYLNDRESKNSLKKATETIFSHAKGEVAITTLPLAIRSHKFGLSDSFLFRLESRSGAFLGYVDLEGSHFKNFESWRQSIALQPNEVIYPKNGELQFNEKNQVLLSLMTPPAYIDESLLRAALNKKEEITNNTPQEGSYEEERLKQITDFKNTHNGRRPNYIELRNLDIYKHPEKYHHFHKTNKSLENSLADYWYKNSDEYAKAILTIASKTTGNDYVKKNGVALANTIGTYLRLKSNQETSNVDDKNLHYSGASLSAIRRVQSSIESIGGSSPNICILPVVVKGPKHGVLPFPLFRVESGAGAQFVDHVGRVYKSFSDWKENNTLPAGHAVVPKNGQLTQNTDRLPAFEVVETPNNSQWNRYVMPTLNGVAVVGGIAVVGTSIVMTGGAAAPAWLLWGGGALAGFGAINSGANLYDRYKHNQSINPMQDFDARSAWLGVAGGMTGLAAIATSLRFAQVAGKSMMATEAGIIESAEVSKGLNVLASAKKAHVTNVTDQYVAAASIADYTKELSTVYKQMTPEELTAAGALGITIPAAMLAIGVKQSGGLRASFNPLQLPKTYDLPDPMDIYKTPVELPAMQNNAANSLGEIPVDSSVRIKSKLP